MITLYDYLPSQNAWKVRLLLNHLDIPYKQEFISIFEGEGRSAEYQAVNPTGAVPAIKIDDGSTIAESNAILVYLAKDSCYFPSTSIESAKVLQWLFFESDYVQSSVATLRHWKLTGKDANRTKEIISSKYDASISALSILDRTLHAHEFLSGAHYTIADMSVFAYVHLSEDAGVSLAQFENLQRWIRTVSAQPGFLNEMYPYSIDENSFREL